MRDLKIKFMSPPIYPKLYFHLGVLYNTNFILPYGLGILTAFLRDNNYDVVLDDLSLKTEKNNRIPNFFPSLKINLDILRHKKEIIDYACGYSQNRKIERFAEEMAQKAYCAGYDLIGISTMTYSHFLFASLLSKKIKSMSKAKVVLGGPFITIYGKELFEEFPIADYMVVGDGQVPLLRLIEHLEARIPVEDVPNLLYRQNGTIKANPRKFFPIEDLYVPDFSDLPLDLYRSNVEDIGLNLPYQTSRGCTHNCSFCNRRAVNPFFEFKSHNKVVTELEAMKERYRTNSFAFYDEAINCSYEHLDKLCDMFIEEKKGIFWRGLAKSDNLDRKLLHKMKQAGCRFLSFGIESGSNRIIKLMNRFYTAADFKYCVKKISEFNPKFPIMTDILVGFPSETENDFRKTLKLIEWLGRYKVFFQCLSYSKRPNTEASLMPGQIDYRVKQARLRKLNKLCELSYVMRNKNLFMQKSKRRTVIF